MDVVLLAEAKVGIAAYRRARAVVKQALQSDRLQVLQSDRATARQCSSNSAEIDTYQVRIRIAKIRTRPLAFGVSLSVS